LEHFLWRRDTSEPVLRSWLGQIALNPPLSSEWQNQQCWHHCLHQVGRICSKEKTDDQ
jgi:hypothetical protein